MSNKQNQTILCKFQDACPVVKSLAWAGAVVVFSLSLYLPQLNEKVDRIDGIESKVDMILMILRGDVANNGNTEITRDALPM